MATISLKNQALLYVICNLEHFPPKVLEVLPSDVRHELLSNLPAIDICQLEETGVAADITPNSLWDEICMSRIPRRCEDVERNIMYEVYTDDWKAYYFGIITHVLLDHIKPEDYRSHYELVLHLLFGVQDCLNIFDWSSYRFSYFPPITNNRPLIPNRHLRYLTARRSDVHFLNLIMEISSYRPKFFYIVCELFAESEVYEKHASELLARYLCSAEKVVFSTDLADKAGVNPDKTPPYDIASLVLKAVLSNDPPALKGLEFREFGPEMLDQTLKVAGPLFYAAYSSLSSKANKHIPYRGLHELVVDLNSTQGVSGEVLQKLSTIIKGQTKLEKVMLNQLVVDKAQLSDRYLKFLSSLSPFIKKPHFNSLNIKRMVLAVEGVQNVTDAFLSSPALHRQRLCFERSSIIGEPSEDEPARKLSMHPQSTEFKSLEFYSCDLPANFFNWFFGHPQIWLRKLELANCKFQESIRTPYSGRPENVIHLAAMLQDLKIQYFEMNNVKPPHCRTSADDFKALLSNPNLKSFSLRSANVGHHGLLLDLTAGLMKQKDVGSLESFSVVNNELGDLPNGELQQFFDALFSIPSIETCDLNLSHNDFLLEHYYMMYETWKSKSDGKRFKTFSCVGRSFPKEDTELPKKLDEMAVKCYHW